jgi:hypothetical protein
VQELPKQLVVQVVGLPLTQYVCCVVCALALIASVAKMIAIAFFILLPLKVQGG